jgi:arabinose-5-phosphate isomerase
MTKNPVTIKHDILAIEALNIMEQRVSQISVLPITDDNGHYFGIIRLHDLIRAGL